VTIDALIAGGGQVGLALALSLRRSSPDLAVTLIDASPANPAERQGRASTVAAGARHLLEQLGVWDRIADQAQPVTSMVVTDSRTGDAVRPVFLTFATADDAGAAAHIVPDDVVVGALREAAQAAGVVIVTADAVIDFTVGGGSVRVRTRGGASLSARLLAAADGAGSRLRGLGGINTIGWSYGQSGIVATVTHDRPHGGRAEEHFLPGGPFAILPLKADAEGRNRSSLVWTEPSETAQRLIKDRLVFAMELERRFGHRLGPISVAGAPQAFPLALQMARTFIKERLVLVGDAAHTIHPVAGQGLNLGYRDVEALAETVIEAHRLGLDIGAVTTLERYQRWRRFDTLEMGLVTDGLTRLFANDYPLLRLVRDVGLGIVDRLPELKRMFMAEASGATASAPRLLRGEAI
jgi:2-octaprenyl-6-methoxyphenol hydroxylase